MSKEKEEKMEKQATPAAPVALYSKADLLSAESLVWNKDVVAVVMNDDEELSLSEVESRVKAFMSRKEVM